MSVLDEIHTQFSIPVLRETDEEKLYALSKSLLEGGLKVLEITLMSDEALKVIKRLSSDKDVIVGAGTVLNQEQARKAMDAGAKFLVSPGLNEGAVVFARNNNIPFIPGVLTPSEIMQASSLGCELVKIFPIVTVGGVSYLKHLKGPFPKLKIMASGGIGLNDMKDYIEAGAYCVGAGSQLTPRESIKNEEWKKIRELAKEYVFEINRLRR